MIVFVIKTNRNNIYNHKYITNLTTGRSYNKNKAYIFKTINEAQKYLYLGGKQAFIEKIEVQDTPVIKKQKIIKKPLTIFTNTYKKIPVFYNHFINGEQKHIISYIEIIKNKPKYKALCGYYNFLTFDYQKNNTVCRKCLKLLFKNYVHISKNRV